MFIFDVLFEYDKGMLPAYMNVLMVCGVVDGFEPEPPPPVPPFEPPPL
jgi:hypothetical protein